MIHFILTLIFWSVYGWMLTRAVRHGKLCRWQDCRFWLMFGLAILAFSFWGPVAEQRLDQLLHDYPVALYLKYGCLIGCCYLYHGMLRDVDAISYSPTQRLLTMLAPVSLFAGVVGFVIYVRHEPLPLSDLRYLVIGGRDAVIATYIIFSFWNGTLKLLQSEHVPWMRFKQASIVIFFTCFLITSVGSVSAALMTAFGTGNADYAATVLQPFIYPAVIFFLVMLIPFRWFMVIDRLRQLIIYWRLQRVRMRVTANLDTRHDMYTMSLRQMLLNDAINNGIYRTLISILDSYPMASHDEDLRASVHRLVSKSQSYDELVKGLARL